MKINYFTFNSGNSKGTSIKYLLFGLVMLLSVSFGYSQETMTITTTSDDANWVINFTNSGGAPLSWLATGAALPPGGIAGTGNNPVFDFSANGGNAPITITITSTDNFDFVTILLAPGREITDVDVDNLDNLIQLEMPSNELTSIDLEFNTALQRLDLDNNDLTSVDVSTNVNLITLDASFNEIATVDVAGIPNLVFLDLSNNELTTIDLSGNNQLTQINLDFNLLVTAAIGQVIDEVDAYGTGGFGHILSLTGNPGDIPASSIDGVNNLLARDWIVRPPVIYDFGDAPNSYGTDISSNGPQHIIGNGDLNLGAVFDDEFDGFGTAGTNADGDDLDKVADEDGVDPLDLIGITTSIDAFSVDVSYTNNTSQASNIYAWIDFDRSGTFDADEFTSFPIPNNSTSSVTLSWTNLIANGVDIVEGDTYARFRTTSDVLTGADTGGVVNNGEVEDYFLVIEPDTDRDGVPDAADLDADNDGILNTDETGDSNGNGIDDSLELDADGDGCFDTLEAGVLDGDEDGYVGTGILTSANVDANGLVISDDNGAINSPADAYGPLNDLNGNGTLDSQEVGAPANITTEPTDQDLIIGDVTFTVVTDLAAGDENYQWEENIGGNTAWLPITDLAGSYAGAQTASLVVTNTDVSRLTDRYRVVVSNIAYACDPETTSVDVGYITPEDFDLDGIFDIVDVDDDNDGILDTVEPGNTDPGTNEDRINLDSDGDGCFDVTEAGFTDDNGDGFLGNSPVTVDANGQVTSGSDGYTAPNDLNSSGTPDFQEVGAPANITTEPTDQDLIIGDVTFTVVTDLAAGDENYQWEENIGGNTSWLPITDAAGSYAGAQTASLVVTNTDAGRVADRYRVVVSNIAFACDPTTTSVEVGYITPDDFDLDGVFDIVDVDDDNDGILDVDEVGNTDPGTNEDRINLDADSDGCFDVTEAGFTDDNGDGFLGNAPVTVDVDGRVTSGSDGYTTPNDLNGNLIADFQEAGAVANITTDPVEQEYVQSGVAIFSVLTDLAAGDEFYQWQEDSGAGFVDITDGVDFAGTNTADLSVTIPANFDKVFNRYRVLVRNVAYACDDPGTFSVEVGFVIPGDFDRDGVFDVDDLDDDNDGILDTVEDDGVVDRDTDGDGSPDKRDFDADGDGCFDTLESGVLDGDSNGLVGTGIITSANVDADGLVVSDANGAINAPGDAYGPLNDLDNNGTADFQEEGFAASITTDPTDQDFILGGSATFTATAVADTYQWEVSIDGGSNWTPLTNDANNAGVDTNTLVVSNLTINEYDNNTYRLVAEYVSYVCDVVPAESLAAGFNSLADFDGDTVPDVVDVDDDNDGILDVTEAGNTDPGTNPDATNLDADGDGCFDVAEALTTNVIDPDPDGDGILGTSPVTVDASGQVTGQGGYTTPNDLDMNGTPDFQEAGAAAAITTQPVDQNFIPGGAVTFDVVATADTYQWQEDSGSGFVNIVDGGDYSGANTANLTVSNVGIGMLGYTYRVIVNNIAYACDPTTTSDVATLVSLPDNDNDGVPDIVDVDDDNDGIFDTVEDAGPNGGDSNNNTIPDRFELDSDSDGCDDVVEAGFTDGDGDGLLGNSPVTVDPLNGQVTSGTDGYTTPNDLDNNGTLDFQEAGDVANISDNPSDQDFVLNGSASFTATSDGDTYQWEISINGASFVPLSDDTKYSGTATGTLIVSDLLIPDYFNEYRVVVTNIAFVCDPGDTSDAASYNILDDTDNDGVFDIVDVDDDNDGIFDTVEGEVTDTNLDGRPDRISLDSDSDGCADAIEAGFTDPDGDGILGTSPVTVDANGQVTGQGGYTTPNDLDNNGVFDFQEAGEPSSIENQPEEIEIALGDDAIFEISSVATFYQWQQSMDDGNSWSDLVNDSQYSGVTTDRLLISDARGRLEGSRYRVILTSPDYACDPNDMLVSDNVRLVFNTELIPSGFSPNGDGENDLFSVPGLIETPDFTMEVFDRWGNSVYKYDNNGSLNPDWWDGKSTGNMTLSKGQLVPAGTYFYLIQYNDGNKSPDKGWVYVNY